MRATTMVSYDEDIPYTVKHLRAKTLAIFAALHPTANVLQRIVN